MSVELRAEQGPCELIMDCSRERQWEPEFEPHRTRESNKESQLDPERARGSQGEQENEPVSQREPYRATHHTASQRESQSEPERFGTNFSF